MFFSKCLVHETVGIILPQAGGLGVSALEDRLADEPHRWDHLLKNLALYRLQVQLPVLSLHSRLNLRDAIQKASTPSNFSILFDPATADFSAVSLTSPLVLVDVVQHVQVNITAVPVLPSSRLK